MAVSKLVMAVHTMEAATATVPFSMILLLDHAKRKTMPETFKIRMVIPSGGLTSVSLWDVEDPDALKTWLDENLGQDCANEVCEVQETFTYGVMLELARARAAEKVTSGGLKTFGALGERTTRAAEMVAAGVNTAVESTTHRLGEWDKRTGVLTSAKETTSATASKMAEVASKVASDERVAAVMAGVQQGVSSGWQRMQALLGTGGRPAPEYYGAPGAGGGGAAAGAGGGGGGSAAYPATNYEFRQDSLDQPLSSLGEDMGYAHPAATLAPTTHALPAGGAAAAAAAGADAGSRPPVSSGAPST